MVTNDLVRWKEGRMLWDSIRVPQLQPGFTFTILFMFSTNKCSHAEASHNRSYSPFNWIEWIYSIVRSHHPETPVPSHTTYSTTVMMFKCHIISTATVWSKMLIIRSLISLILIWYGQWQGCIFRLTCSHPELTKDMCSQVRMLKFLESSREMP